MIELQLDLLSIFTSDELLNLSTLVQKQCLAGRPMIQLHMEHLIIKR